MFKVSVTEVMQLRDSLGMKIKSPGKKKPIVETVSGCVREDSTGALVEKERLLDRQNNRYRECVKRDNGNVIRDVDEPLNQRTGHGSVKLR